MTYPLLFFGVRASLGDCLALCGRRATHPPRPELAGAYLRSRELSTYARRAHPDWYWRCRMFGAGLHRGQGQTCAQAFSEFLRRRRVLLGRRSRASFPPPERLEHEVQRPMSLLLTEWDALLPDATAQERSGGFFEADLIAPWDTWLALLPSSSGRGGCLLSWVPPWATSLVDGAIESAPGACLSWANPTGDDIQARGWGRPWSPPLLSP